MEVKSCHTTRTDPYRAGLEIGAGLAEIKPEIIFLFPSIHYQGSAELSEAIYDELGNDNIILIGNTGDGFYEHNGAGHIGVSALAINSNGKVRWHLAASTGIGTDPAQAVSRCTDRLEELMGANEPSFYFLCSDFRTDTTKLSKALQQKIRKPLVGGSATDDYSFDRSFVYTNREVREDCMALLAAEGPLNIEIMIANQMEDIGRTGTITACSGTTVDTIDHMPANHFLEQEIGHPLTILDEGVLTMKLMNSHQKQPCLRSMLLDGHDMNEGKILLFGGVEKGNIVQICHTPADRILNNIQQIASEIKTRPIKPEAALIISCSGRKKVAGDDIWKEAEIISQSSPSLKALAGYPSFGEYGPAEHGNENPLTLFHNMTCIILFIGESEH